MYIAVLLAFSLNFDALGVGMAYGVRGIKIPLLTMLFLSLSSAAYARIAGQIGKMVLPLFPVWFGRIIGMLILLAIGVFTLISALREPPNYDFDHSKTIDLKEGFALSLALSLDAAGAALSLASDPEVRDLLPLLIGLCQFCFLLFGKTIGARLSSHTECSARALNLSSGILLILLALLRLVP